VARERHLSRVLPECQFRHRWGNSGARILSGGFAKLAGVLHVPMTPRENEALRESARDASWSVGMALLAFVIIFSTLGFQPGLHHPRWWLLEWAGVEVFWVTVFVLLGRFVWEPRAVQVSRANPSEGWRQIRFYRAFCRFVIRGSVALAAVLFADDLVAHKHADVPNWAQHLTLWGGAFIALLYVGLMFLRDLRIAWNS
jgi:hypothetical protein